MKGRRKAAQSLVILGCLILAAGAGLHLAAAYPRVSAEVAASNLNAGLQSALRAVFLMIGWDWIVIAIVVLIAAFSETKLRKPVVVFLGAALLVQAAVMLRLIGWFLGTDMILTAGLLTLCGGLLFERPALLP